jgi:hypothetical protein
LDVKDEVIEKIGALMKKAADEVKAEMPSGVGYINLFLFSNFLPQVND